MILIQPHETDESSKQIATMLQELSASDKDMRIQISNELHEQYPSVVIVTTQAYDQGCRDRINTIRNHYKKIPYIIVSDTEVTLQQMKRIDDSGGAFVPASSLSTSTLYTALKRLGYHEDSGNILYTDTFFQHNPLPMLVYNKETLQLVSANNAALQQYGYTIKEFLRMSMKDLRPAQNEVDLQNVILAESEGGRFHDFGIRKHKKKDGTVFYVHVFVHTQNFKHKKHGIVICVNVDDRENAIIENNKLNEELQREKQRALQILHSVEEVLWTRDAETLELLDINPACEQIYGYTPEEMIGTTITGMAMIHPEDLSKVTEEILRTNKEGKADTEYRIVDRSGNVKHLITKAVYHKGANGDRDTVSGITLDISALKNTETLLKEKAKELNKVLDSITDGFFHMDKEWKFVFVNKTFEEVCGIRKEDTIGKHYTEVFPFDSVKVFADRYEEAIAKNEPIHFEEYSGMLDLWLLVNAYPYEGGLRVYFSDITEERELQEHIKRSELTLRGIINNTDDIIWAVDRDLRITYANNMFYQRVKNFTEDTPNTGDLIIPQYLPEEQKQRYTQYYTDALQGKRSTITEEHKDANGETRYLETSYYPIEDIDGEITGISCYMRDITERRNYIKNIEEANKRLQDIAWLQSHKVRSHTATILGMVQLYNADTPNAADNNDVMQGIKEAAEYLDNAIREITEKTKLHNQST